MALPIFPVNKRTLGTEITAAINPKNIIIHDSARPLFNPYMINEGIKGLKKFSCVVPIIKIVDTVKKVDGAELSTIDRSNLYYSQTPQKMSTLLWYLE